VNVRHEVKTVKAQYKARKEGDKGIVTAIVSVFNNVDLGGDRMLPGAFTDTIADWQAKGDPVPVIWSHMWDDPFAHIGYVDPQDLKETEQGLEVKMQYDLDKPMAAQVFDLQKTRRVTQFSFGYYAEDEDIIEDPVYGKVREVTKVQLFEVGPTLLGMNPATQLLEAASGLRDGKQGRVLSSKNEQNLKDARDLIDNVLVQLNRESASSDRPKKAAEPRQETKATAEEAVEGAFATWIYRDDQMIGRIEHVMTEGILGVPESSFQLEASAENPAVLLRIFDDADGGYVETEMFMGARASDVTIVPDPREAETESKSVVEAETDNPEFVHDAQQGERDDSPSIDNERLTTLLARPKYQEE